MEVKPLSSLNALLSWNGPGLLKKFLCSIQNLSKKSTLTPICSSGGCESSIHYLTLVCHDFKGGYVDDRYCFGSSTSDAYRFFHWNSVDIFVYFSHHFITIPPSGWVQAAHINGVKVLGTVITEWDHGKSIWETLLNDEATIDLAINNLVEIAQTYRFEGWLLNVENEIEPEKVKDVVYFVSELTRRMRHRDPNSMVIWYDSVTSEGKLKWQNKLNERNRCFFDVCDGIFLNYTWDEQCLLDSVSAAKGRVADVFVGMDTFGRNFFEGGGFNSYKALDLIRKYDLSAAVFAQGWTYEVFGSECFFSNANKLWESFKKFLLYHGPTQLPLKTSFCQGFGKKIFSKGKVLEEGPWFNLSKLQIQPLWEQISQCCSVNTDEAFSGGSSLAFWLGGESYLRLMVCEIELVPLLEFSFVYKVKGSFKYLSFNFSVQRLEDSVKRESHKSSSEICFVAEEKSETGKSPNGSIVREKVEDTNGWIVKTYLLPRSKGWITDFGIKAEGPGVLLFGEFSIKQRHFGQVNAT